MTPDEATKLHDRVKLYEELDDLLFGLPEKASDFLSDPRLSGEAEAISLLEEIRAIGQRYDALANMLEQRLEEATWDHISKRFGLARGDAIEYDCWNGTQRIRLESALPWSYRDDEFALTGPRLLANGKPGKKTGTLFIHQQTWRKL